MEGRYVKKKEIIILNPRFKDMYNCEFLFVKFMNEQWRVCMHDFEMFLFSPLSLSLIGNIM